MKNLLKSSSDIKDLNSDNDLFYTIPKGEAIIKLFKEQREALLKNDLRMVALYGNWGSGKTTLLNFIRKNLEANDTRENYLITNFMLFITTLVKKHKDKIEEIREFELFDLIRSIELYY